VTPEEPQVRAMLVRAELDFRRAARRFEYAAVTEPRWAVPAGVAFMLAQRIAKVSGRLPW
jgi:hypothetical protein